MGLDGGEGRGRGEGNEVVLLTRISTLYRTSSWLLEPLPLVNVHRLITGATGWLGVWMGF